MPEIITKQLQTQISTKLYKLFSKCDKQLDTLTPGARPFGYVSMALGTGIGKSYTALKYGIDKIKNSTEPSQIIYTATTTNNLPTANKFNSIKANSADKVAFIESNTNSEKRFNEQFSDEKALSNWFNQDFGKYIAHSQNEISLIKPVLANSKTDNALVKALEEYRIGVQSYQNIEATNNDTAYLKTLQERNTDTKRKITCLLSKIMQRLMIYEQLLDNGTYYKLNLKRALQNAHIELSTLCSRKGSDITKVNKFIRENNNKLDLKNAARFMWNFSIVRLLYSQVGLLVKPISVLTVQKLFYRTTLIVKTYPRLYKALVDINDAKPLILVDEVSAVKDKLEEHLADDAMHVKDLYANALPFTDLIDRDKKEVTYTPTGLIGTDKKQTYRKIELATDKLEQIKNKYKITSSIYLLENEAAELDKTELMFATSPHQRLSNNNQSLWIGISDDDNNKLQLIDLTQFNPETGEWWSKELKDKYKGKDNNFTKSDEFKEAYGNLYKKYKSGDFTYYPLVDALSKLHVNFVKTCRSFPQMAFNSRDTERLRKMSPKFQDGDTYAFYQELFGQRETENIDLYTDIADSGVNDSNLSSYESTIDNHGFSLFRLQISPESKRVTIEWSFVPNTADRLWLDFVQHFKVFGIDALGDVQSDFRSFAFPYLKQRLHSHFIAAQDKDLRQLLIKRRDIMAKILKPQLAVTNINEATGCTILATSFLLEAKNISDLAKALSGNGVAFKAFKVELEKLLYKNDSQDLMLSLAKKSQKDNKVFDYYAMRWLKALQSVFRFLNQHKQNDAYRSMLCFIPAALNLKQLNAIRKIITLYCKLHQIEFDDTQNAVKSWNAQDFKGDKPAYKKDLRDLTNGKCKIIFTTYNTMATGQNVNYIAPDDLLNSEFLHKLGPDYEEVIQKDWDAIYLAQPTHNINANELDEKKSITTKSLILQILHIYDLAQVGGLSPIGLKTNVTEVLASPAKNNLQKKQYNFFSVKAYITKLCSQALGRINRTMHRLDQLVYADSDLYNHNGQGMQLLDPAILKSTSRPLAVLTVLEQLCMGKQEDSSQIESAQDNLYHLMLASKFNHAEDITNDIKNLVKNHDNPNRTLQFAAHDFMRAYGVIYPTQTKESYQEMSQLIDNLTVGQPVVHRAAKWIRDYLNTLYFEVQKPANEYWYMTTDGQINDMAFGESPNATHIDLSSVGRFAQTMQIKGFKEYLQANYQTIGSLLSNVDCKALVKNDRAFEAILNRPIDWSLKFDKVQYLPTPAFYNDQLGMAGELINKYIFAKFGVELCDFDSSILNGVLVDYKEVADFVVKPTSSNHIIVIDTKNWSRDKSFGDYLIARHQKINSLLNADGIESVDYVFVNIKIDEYQINSLHVMREHADSIIDKRIHLYSVPGLYNFKRNAFFDDKIHGYYAKQMFNFLEELKKGKIDADKY